MSNNWVHTCKKLYTIVKNKAGPGGQYELILFFCVTLKCCAHVETLCHEKNFSKKASTSYQDM